ncbi:MAG: glycosyl hydrolase 115 family protein [Eubacterium sp.]|nr:glycosyl hydrolase 115 family protein [Eubacterium sp.]
MNKIIVKNGEVMAELLIEEESYEGVKRIGEIVAEDVELVCGTKPEIFRKLNECHSSSVILMASLGSSPVVDRLVAEGKLSISSIENKREVFLIKMLDAPFEEAPQIEKMMVIVGSDKRGTIYGMFHFSECCGISPLVYFGDVYTRFHGEDYSKPLVLDQDIECISREPSIKYRGFFINDEWPAFGKWCTEKFGGINAKAYEKIFQLLLRLKGNYLWPAMWKSSFSDDGPGLLSAQLADIYGVVMGTSHHEPLCRAGLEWQRDYALYGEDSTWSFVSNSDAIAKFWEDGVIRNRRFENLITIGMRGEDDSKLLSEDATIKENIDVIKKAILCQHDILRKHLSEDLKNIPRMIAIYKEVEDYYLGDETCEGLKDWDELDDVIFLLSDDNYGNLRGLPNDETRKHPGGYGMYYHFDYHGAPTSYEWLNNNRLTKTWEQMTQAYEAGVRELWIVNVGDIKGVEYPLCYFMDLAYDYDRWGSDAINQTEYYAKRWIDIQFGDTVTPAQKEKIATVMEGYTKWNAIRASEAMNENIFHPVHFRECDRVKEEVESIISLADELVMEISENALEIYQNMIYYPAVASLNTVLMCVNAGLNKMLAKRGCIYANVYGEKTRELIKKDREIIEAYHMLNNSKWNHTMDSAHVGFRGWDDNDWTLPTTEVVSPIYGAKSVVSFRGSDEYHLGAHWQDIGPLKNDDMIRHDVNEVLVDLDSRGNVSYSYSIKYRCPWLICEEKRGRVEVTEGGRKTVIFGIDREKIEKRESASVVVDILFDNGEKTYSTLEIEADTKDDFQGVGKECKNVFIEKNGYCCIRAEHFSGKRDIEGEGFRVVDYLGREGSAIKAFPAMKVYPNADEAPYVKYSAVVESAGKYKLELYLLARNAAETGGSMKFGISVNDGKPWHESALSETYYTEWYCDEWARGVLSHVRKICVDIELERGYNEVFFYGCEPGIILEKILIHRADFQLPESYLGPGESLVER